MARALMGTDNILDLQNNGYKSTVSAIAEIVDNSIQANASNVDIILLANTTSNRNVIEEILILDDGNGMDAETFDKALQMSSGSNKNARKGLGRYGQGLPNSSISQTTRVEVFTKTKSASNWLYNYIDLHEIHDSGRPFLPDVEQKVTIEHELFKKELNKPTYGTLVRWVKPNRVRPKTAKTLAEHINKIAGRLFRHYLLGWKEDGVTYKTKIQIKVFDTNGVTISQNKFLSRNVVPFDPLFLMKKTQMNSLFPNNNHPTSNEYEHQVKKEFDVEIKFSYCRREERDLYGRNAGTSDFGKAYLHRNMPNSSGYDNITILRAGREIDSGRFGFVTDISDPTQRWWSAEICVEPVIDSIIGIDNKKQQASEIKAFDATTASNEDVHEIIRWINTYLTENLKAVKKLVDFQQAPEPKPNPDSPVKPLPGATVEPGVDIPAPQDVEPAKRDLESWIKQRYPQHSESEIKKMVEWAFGIRDTQIFIYSDLGDSALYSYKVYGTKILIEINSSHSFYDKFMKQFENESSKSIRALKLLIGSLVAAEINEKTEKPELTRDRRNIKRAMAETLHDYIEDLFRS